MQTTFTRKSRRQIRRQRLPEADDEAPAPPRHVV